MRVVLISDIHGNATALAAVIEQITNEAPDQIVCLGDVAAMGPQPAESLQLVKDLACPVVMGNTDAWLLDPVIADPADERSRRIQEINLWCVEQVQPHLEYMQTFQPTVEIDMGDGVELLCFHGTPRSNTENIDASTPDEAVKEAVGGSDATILAGGHTHAQLLRRIGGQWLINPGSVGLTFHKAVTGAREIDPPWAEFAVVEQVDGRITISMRAIPFPVRLAQETAMKSGMPEAAWWSQGWRPQSEWQ